MCNDGPVLMSQPLKFCDLGPMVFFCVGMRYENVSKIWVLGYPTPRLGSTPKILHLVMDQI